MLRRARTAPVRARTASGLLVALVALLAVVLPGSPPSAEAASRWAPAAKATIHPGVQMYTKGAQCTANFVFKDRRGRVYVGYAAHCAGKGAATDTDGCTAKSFPVGTWVRFAEGGSPVGGGTSVGRGRLAYSSWLTMQRLHTRNPDACSFNDLALVRVGRAHLAKVNPSVPFWGGPAGLHRGGSSTGDPVYSYGSSSLRSGALGPKQGTSLGTAGHGWSHIVYTASPGIPGDSGSAFLDGDGKALGTLSTVALAPLAGSNGVGDLRHELAFARRHSGIPGLHLVRGTEDFAAVL
jgi:hypothetical protein